MPLSVLVPAAADDTQNGNEIVVLPKTGPFAATGTIFDTSSDLKIKNLRILLTHKKGCSVSRNSLCKLKL